MAYTTPKTFTATTLTVTDMNQQVSGNVAALRTAQKITATTNTSNTSFSTSASTAASFSYTFNSGTTYLVEASWYGVQPATAAEYLFNFTIEVGATTYGGCRVRTDDSTTTHEGGSARGYVTGVSGSQTVALKVSADSGTGHTLPASATSPVILTLTPLDVV